MIIFRFSLIRLLVFLVAFNCCQLPVQASDAQRLVPTIYSGNDLLKLCRSAGRLSERQQARRECIGYIVGVADSQMLSSAGLEIPQSFCLPASVSYVRLADLVTADLTANLAEMHTSAAGLVWLSLMKAFPCNEASKK